MTDLKNHDAKIEYEKNRITGGTLYLVATPIGNLSDISARALKVLSGVDFIAAEDTRNSGKMLSLLGVAKKPMLSYFEHNKREKGEIIAERLLGGQSCALITDAGTPGISDPGEDIVSLCAEKGITVTSVPGCCAAVNALILSGLPTSRFVFEGFLSGTKSEKTRRLRELMTESRTVIFYESPHRLKETLSRMLELFGDRKLALCREMTKMNEEIMRMTLSKAVAYYSENPPRGEYVLIVSGCDASEINKCKDNRDIPSRVQAYIDTGMTKTEAIKQVAKDDGVPKSNVYDIMVEHGKKAD